jgi:excinuclease ABC subunit C
MPLNKFHLDIEQKNTLEKLLNRKIYIRNSFENNQKEIQGLLEQGLVNAQIYLERNFLGQKLAILDENKVFESVINLGKFLKLKKIPRRIECYDISHIQGKFVYGSMVVFVDGIPVNKYYRLFKCKEQNNDFANHFEVLSRRLKRSQTDKNPAWQLPDLIIVDGGIGQLNSDISVLKNMNLFGEVEIVSIAKKEEEIFCPDMTIFDSYKLGSQGGLLLEGNTKFLCQRIRDEAHRFAIKNNKSARIRNIKFSQLNQIEGVGEKTKQKILIEFGSVQNMVQNLYDNPELVLEKLGKTTFDKLKNNFLL